MALNKEQRTAIAFSAVSKFATSQTLAEIPVGSHPVEISLTARVGRAKPIENDFSGSLNQSESQVYSSTKAGNADSIIAALIDRLPKSRVEEILAEIQTQVAEENIPHGTRERAKAWLTTLRQFSMTTRRGVCSLHVQQ